jgi:hypothetical protein
LIARKNIAATNVQRKPARNSYGAETHCRALCFYNVHIALKGKKKTIKTVINI